MVRKISVGPDPFKQMHYILGQSVLDKTWVISTMREVDGDKEIWISKDGEEVIWKKFTREFQCVVEYNIDYSHEITTQLHS
jgi:hypothetical protein